MHTSSSNIVWLEADATIEDLGAIVDIDHDDGTAFVSLNNGWPNDGHRMCINGKTQTLRECFAQWIDQIDRECNEF